MGAGAAGNANAACQQKLLRRLFRAVLCVILPCVASAAAEDGATPVAEKRAPFPERVERAATRVADELERMGLYPYVTSLATGGGAAPGVAYFDPTAGGGRLGLYGGLSQSVKGDSLLEVRLGRIPHEPGRAPSRRPGFEWMPGFVAGERGERFYAFGQAKLLELGAGRYLQGYSDPLRQESFDAVAGYRLSPKLALQAQAGILSVSPGRGAHSLGMEFAPALDAPGLAWRRDYARFSSEVAWDGRARPRNPRGGQFASLRLDRYQGLGATPDFSRASLDVRHFQSLGSERHVLALRALASVADTDGVAVPFYLQDSLGGGSILRSYAEHRFWGDRLLAFSAEYRFQAAPWLQLAAFHDGGRAWGGFSSLDSGGFRSSTGVGLRLTTPTRVLLRFDVARGDDGARLNVKAGYSF